MSKPIANEREHWPCADYPGGSCPRRQPGCQDRCMDMLAAKLIAGEERKRLRTEKERSRALDELKVHGIEKYNRRKAGQR